MEPEITLGAKVVVIGVDREVYERKKALIGRIGVITQQLDDRIEVCFDSIDYCFFYERNLSLDLSLAEDFPVVDRTTPEIKIAKYPPKIKNTRIRKRNPKRR